MAKILIIEDSEEVQLCLSRIIKRMGHEIVTASEGNAGLNLVQTAEVDIVISDLHMPGELEGPNLIRRVRELKPNVPVVVVSGYPSDCMDECYAMGIKDFLVKPFEISFLSQVIDRILSESNPVPRTAGN